MTVNNSNVVQVDDGATLKLSGTEIIGGIINDFSDALGGTIDVIGSSKIDGGATLNNGAVTVESSQTLTLDNVTVAGTVITDTDATSIVRVDGGQTATLSGATIKGGTVNIDGTLDSTGISAITNASIHNTGTIEATAGVLTIDPTVAVTLNNSGTIEANGGELDLIHQTVGNTGTLEAVDGSLLVLNNTTVNNAGGTVEAVDPGQSAISTVDLQSATINGGVVATISDGIIDATSGINAINGAIINNAGRWSLAAEH